MTTFKTYLSLTFVFLFLFNFALAEEVRQNSNEEILNVEKLAAEDKAVSESPKEEETTKEALWYRLEKLEGVKNQDDFVVGPGKFEIEVEPGQSVTKEISITNRISDGRVFEISVEDISGTNDTERAVVLLGDERGPYTIKDYISIPKKTIALDLGERAWIPITITVPKDAEPGGHYGSVLISTIREGSVIENAPSTPIVAKIGTLFFLTIPGEMDKAGLFKEFGTINKQKWFEGGPIKFNVLYENTGSVHLNPYGELRITNIFGEEVGFVELDPWFSLPKSLRSRDVVWDRELLFGRYTASASINLGYDNVVDEKSVVFWVLPWKIMLGIFAGIFIIIFILRIIFRNFEFRRK